MNFCVAILILMMEENSQHFWHIMLYYFKKDKNTTEMQKKTCVPYGEGAVTDEWVKSGLWSLMSGISCWTMLHGQVEVDSNQMETSIEKNQCYAMGDITDIIKISKSRKFLVKMKNVF